METLEGKLGGRRRIVELIKKGNFVIFEDGEGVSLI
jgi:hypothetical protein